MAAERHIKIGKADDFTRSLLVRTDKRGHLSMENELINMLSIGNEPHNGRLEDPAGHAGTVVSGLTANFLFVEPFNSQYDTDIAPLTDAEILEDAGITHNTSNAAPNTTSNTAKTSTTTVLSNRNSALLIVFAGGMVLILLIAIGSLKFRRH